MRRQSDIDLCLFLSQNHSKAAVHGNDETRQMFKENQRKIYIVIRSQEPKVPGSMPGLVTYVPSGDSRRAVISYWRKYSRTSMARTPLGP